MSLDSIWITGSSQSGKTTRLIQQLITWAEGTPTYTSPHLFSKFLVFAATGDNRLELADRLATATQGQYQFDSVTPLGFFQDEVSLFLPLVVQQLQLKAQFPLRLRPETEQELATGLWRPLLDEGRLRQEGVRDYYLVRRTLDLLQLAAASGISHEEIPAMLRQGFDGEGGSPDLWDTMGEALEQWWNWCLERGLLTYGIVTELYWRYLLPDLTYQHHLKRRYRAVLADDVDEYPAVMRTLLEFFLDQSLPVVFTYNPDGGIRLGLGADPSYLEGLSARCSQVKPLPHSDDHNLGTTWGAMLTESIEGGLIVPQLPESIQSIQTTSRAEMLRQTAEVIVEAIQTGQVAPQEVAIVAPGVDAIARYTLREILSRRGISLLALNDQRPLASSPLIRALLTLLALVYPGLGRLLSREAVAEMLVVFSHTMAPAEPWNWGEMALDEATASGDANSPNPIASGFAPSPSLAAATNSAIDPVRAGLLTDHCFVPDPEQPRLLAATTFPRWDRLGYQATHAYEEILQWLDTQRLQQQQRLIPSPIVLLDRAIQRFLQGGSHLPYDQLAALRELMETAQHYWEVDTRLQQHHQPQGRSDGGASSVGQFIQLLRDGTITADPFPVRPLGRANQAVTLATVYQYRSDRRAHRWQFWLDAGSPFWLTGGGGLFGAPLFLHDWSGRPWTTLDTLDLDQRRLKRQVLDLLYRAKERVFLCYSELATNGQEQTGPLVSLVNMALPVVAPELATTQTAIQTDR